MSGMNCPVCFEEFDGVSMVTTQCGHTFHRICLRRWLDSHQTCPLCRDTIANYRPDILPVFENCEFHVVDIDDDIRMFAPVQNVEYVRNDEGIQEDGSDNVEDEDSDPDYVMSDGSESE